MQQLDSHVTGAIMVHLFELPRAPPQIARKSAQELVSIGITAKNIKLLIICKEIDGRGALHPAHTMPLVLHELAAVTAAVRPVVAAAAMLLAMRPLPLVAVPLIARENA